MTPLPAARKPDAYRKVRQSYERRYGVRFSDEQWLVVVDEAMSMSGPSTRSDAYLLRLHQTADSYAKFLSLGTRKAKGRRKRKTVKGKKRGPYARPLLERIDLVLHVNGCRSMARQLGIRWLWRDFAEAHWKQTGKEESPGVLRRRHQSAKKRLYTAVPVNLRWLLWPEHRAELLRLLGVRNLKALAEEQERPTEWVRGLEARLAADQAHVKSVPAARRERTRTLLEKQHARAIAFTKAQGLKPYHLPTAWEPKLKAQHDADLVYLRSLPPVDPKQRKADRQARTARAAAARKRLKKQLCEEDLAYLRSISRE